MKKPNIKIYIRRCFTSFAISILLICAIPKCFITDHLTTFYHHRYHFITAAAAAVAVACSVRAVIILINQFLFYTTKCGLIARCAGRAGA